MDRRILKELIVKNKLIDEERLRELEALSASSGDTLLETIIKGGYIRDDVLMPLIGDFFGIQWVDIDKLNTLDPSLYGELPPLLKGEMKCLPLYRENGSVVIAVSDPMEIEVVDRLRETTGWRLRLVLSGQEKLNNARKRLESGGAAEETVTEIKEESLGDKRLEDLANEAPIIKLVNLMIMQAISEGASDVHIEPYEKRASIRYRVDGILHETASYPRTQFPAIISRIKVMADLNIAEHRIPQDGRISLRVMDRMYDLRVAIIPALHGEGVVVRILDKEGILLNLSDLGFLPETLETFKGQINKPYGIVLVTGPTGSGKTTTLYGALSSIKSVDKKIITIEDPVEYQLEGILQIHVNAKVGLTFGAGLRSILRLDPDIVMVGEIRDSETAEIAIRAALTGHLVLSTLHTNDAPTAVTRLIDMGIEPYLLSSSLNMALAQRLVRRICKFCKTESPPTEGARAFLDESGHPEVKTLSYGKGCDQCGGTGYSGRTSIYELLSVTEPIRSLINQRTPSKIIREQAKQAGMKFMRDDGMIKVLKGITTLEEVFRVTQMD